MPLKRSKRLSTRQRFLAATISIQSPSHLTTTIAGGSKIRDGDSRIDCYGMLQVRERVAGAKKGLDQALDGVLLAVDKAQKFAEKVDK